VNAKHLIGQFDRVASDPDAVPQIRHLVSELAIRGKLVPQDASDEPAADLLERIADSGEHASARGRARIQTSAGDPSSGPFPLPSNWRWVTFSQIGHLGRGKSRHRPRNDPLLFENGTHKFIQTGDVARSDGTITTYTSMYNEFGLAQSSKWPGGTLCITIAANIADTGILTFDACFPDSVVGFIPSPHIPDARFFEHFLRTVKKELVDFAPATAQKNINLAVLNALRLPLPPVAEQQRIISKLDEVMKLCEELRETQVERERRRDRLATAAQRRLIGDTNDPDAFRTSAGFYLNRLPRLSTRPEHVSELRRTILDLAVRGRLVPQDSDEEPAHQLLQKVDAERSRLRRAGVTRVRKGESALQLVEVPFPVPDGWEWVPLGRVVEFYAGHTPSRNNVSYWENGEYPWVTIGDMVESGYVTNTREAVTQVAREDIFKTAPEPAGTMIMSFKLTIGKVSLLGTPAYHNEGIITIRPYVPELQDFLFTVLPLFSQHGKSKGAIKGATLNRDSLFNIPIPLPPLDEQRRIIDRRNELLRVCDDLEHHLRKVSSKRSHLLESVLHEALAKP
jgi:restriction endonuclease S subunit